MNGRDRQICRKLLAETAVMRDLLEGISLAALCRMNAQRAPSV